MRNRSQQGFTLIELLIVIAIIGILAAVLIPNLLNARKRAFDTATQTCLKEIVTAEEIYASVDPWEYDGTIDGSGITSCTGVTVTPVATSGTDSFKYSGLHDNGANTYWVINAGGVVATEPATP